MIFLLLDFICSYFLMCPTYFILLNIILIEKKDVSKLIVIALILDVLILNKYFFNTIILFLIYFIYKKFKIVNNNLKSYIISLSIIYCIYILVVGLLNHYSFTFLGKFILNNYLVNMIFYILCYKLVEKRIKLSR